MVYATNRHRHGVSLDDVEILEMIFKGSFFKKGRLVETSHELTKEVVKNGCLYEVALDESEQITRRLSYLPVGIRRDDICFGIKQKNKWTKTQIQDFIDKITVQHGMTMMDTWRLILFLEARRTKTDGNDMHKEDRLKVLHTRALLAWKKDGFAALGNKDSGAYVALDDDYRDATKADERNHERIEIQQGLLHLYFDEKFIKPGPLYVFRAVQMDHGVNGCIFRYMHPYFVGLCRRTPFLKDMKEVEIDYLILFDENPWIIDDLTVSRMGYPIHPALEVDYIVYYDSHSFQEWYDSPHIDDEGYVDDRALLTPNVDHDIKWFHCVVTNKKCTDKEFDKPKNLFYRLQLNYEPFKDIIPYLDAIIFNNLRFAEWYSRKRWTVWSGREADDALFAYQTLLDRIDILERELGSLILEDEE